MRNRREDWIEINLNKDIFNISNEYSLKVYYCKLLDYYLLIHLGHEGAFCKTESSEYIRISFFNKESFDELKGYGIEEYNIESTANYEKEYFRNEPFYVKQALFFKIFCKLFEVNNVNALDLIFDLDYIAYKTQSICEDIKTIYEKKNKLKKIDII